MSNIISNHQADHLLPVFLDNYYDKFGEAKAEEMAATNIYETIASGLATLAYLLPEQITEDICIEDSKHRNEHTALEDGRLPGEVYAALGFLAAAVQPEVSHLGLDLNDEAAKLCFGLSEVETTILATEAREKLDLIYRVAQAFDNNQLEKFPEIIRNRAFKLVRGLTEAFLAPEEENSSLLLALQRHFQQLDGFKP